MDLFSIGRKGTVTSIHTIRPNANHEDALWCFRTPGLWGWLSTQIHGPLRRIAEAYVPFRMYRVVIANGAKQQFRLLAIDAAWGRLDLYAFERLPDVSEFQRTETRNAVPCHLSERSTRRIVIERARRIAYSSSFFRLRGFQIRAEFVPLDFYVPYWLSFSGAGERAQLAVLDAVRCTIEGARARELFQDWIVSGLVAPSDADSFPFPNSSSGSS